MIVNMILEGKIPEQNPIKPFDRCQRSVLLLGNWSKFEF